MWLLFAVVAVTAIPLKPAAVDVLDGLGVPAGERPADCPLKIGKIKCEATGDLTDLLLRGSSLTGSISPSVSNLLVVDLANNQLTGVLAPGLFGRSTAYMNLQSNRLSGTLPTTLASATYLSFLDLSDQFHGQAASPLDVGNAAGFVGIFHGGPDNLPLLDTCSVGGAENCFLCATLPAACRNGTACAGSTGCSCTKPTSMRLPPCEVEGQMTATAPGQTTARPETTGAPMETPRVLTADAGDDSFGPGFVPAYVGSFVVCTVVWALCLAMFMAARKGRS